MADFPRNLHGLGDFPTIFPAFSPAMAVARVAPMRAWALRLRPRLALGKLCPTPPLSALCRGLNGLTGLPGAKTILEENVADSVFMVKCLDFRFSGKASDESHIYDYMSICLYVYTNNHI